MASSPAPFSGSPRADVTPSEGAPQLAAAHPAHAAAIEAALLASSIASLSGAAASLRALAAAHPALLAASHELRDALAAVNTAAASATAAAAPSPSARRPFRPPPPPALTLEDVAPYVAQAGHRGLADTALARLNRYLRSEERIWRAISRLPLGLHGRTRLMHAASVGDVARARFLLDHGADVGAVDRFGRCALDYALTGGHAECVAVLRGAGAMESVAFGGVHVATWGPVVGAGSGPDCARSLAVCRGGRIAVGHRFGTIVLRDTATGAVTATLQGHTSYVNALVLLRSGKLASASDDHSVRLWDVDTGVCEAELAGHIDDVYALAELLDGRIASGSWDCSVRVWDVSTLTCTAVLAHASEVIALAALPHGGGVAGCLDGTIALWSAAGVRMATLGGGAGFGAVCSLALLSDGRFAAGHNNPPLIRVWNVKRRACDVVISGHTDDVGSLAALPDGRLLSGSNDHTLKVWDERVLSVRGGAAADTCAATLVGHTNWVAALSVLLDRRMVSASWDGTVRVWQ